MQGWHIATQFILQILSNPAWAGIGVIISTAISIIAILIARQSKISHPRKPHTAKINRSRRPAPHETRYFLRDGYHRAFLAQELVTDLDVIDAKNLNRYLQKNILL